MVYCRIIRQLLLLSLKYFSVLRRPFLDHSFLLEKINDLSLGPVNIVSMLTWDQEEDIMDSRWQWGVAGQGNQEPGEGLVGGGSENPRGKLPRSAKAGPA